MQRFSLADHGGKHGIEPLFDLGRFFQAVGLDLVAQAVEDIHDDRNADIGADQGLLQFVEEGFVHLHKGFEDPFDLIDNGGLGLGEAGFEFVKKFHQAAPSGRYRSHRH